MTHYLKYGAWAGDPLPQLAPRVPVTIPRFIDRPPDCPCSWAVSEGRVYLKAINRLCRSHGSLERC